MKTRAQALEMIRERGQTVVGWARANGFRESIVRSLLYGAAKGKWGESHRAAVQLGIKDGAVINESQSS